MSTPAPRRREPDDEPDAETVIGERLKTYDEDRKAAEDWNSVVKPALLQRQPQPDPQP